MEMILVLSGVVLLLVFMGLRVVPQSQEFVVERFGKYRKTLSAGVNFIVPFIDSVKHKISVLERQLPDQNVSIITKDNVEVMVETAVFYRVVDPAKTVYRIEDIDRALATTTESIIRSAGGTLDLDQLQTSRDSMSAEIQQKLDQAADAWGIDITRTEITDVIVDEQTKKAQRMQLNADRERRAAVAKAEGEKQRVQLEADAELYSAQKVAEAERIKAEAQAYAVEVVAKAIKTNGQAAVDFELAKQQIAAMQTVGASSSSKVVIMPSDATASLGGLSAALATIQGVK
jgi:regulator of protease activity HflC (stomatin/prohibitin superfamily)